MNHGTIRAHSSSEGPASDVALLLPPGGAARVHTLWGNCSQSRGQASRRATVRNRLLPLVGLVQVRTTGVCRVWHTQSEDWFSLRVYWREEPWSFSSWAGDRGTPIFIFILKGVQNAFREPKPHRAPRSSLCWAWTPGKGWCNSTQAKTPEIISAAGPSSRKPARTSGK